MSIHDILICQYSLKIHVKCDFWNRFNGNYGHFKSTLIIFMIHLVFVDFLDLHWLLQNFDSEHFFFCISNSLISGRNI